MANTTFKGPVRSQNGFQQLVDGVWTPVGGGGGGGTSVLVPFPTDGGTTVYTQAPLTEPGQMVTITSSWPTLGIISGNILIEVVKPGAVDAIVVFGTLVVAGDTPNEFYEESEGFAAFNSNYPFQMQLTYLGNWKESPSAMDPLAALYYAQISVFPIG